MWIVGTHKSLSIHHFFSSVGVESVVETQPFEENIYSGVHGLGVDRVNLRLSRTRRTCPQITNGSGL